MPKSSQANNSATPKFSGLWERVCEVLGTSSTGVIAERLGISAPSVSEWKKTGSTPSIAMLLKIANLGNTSIDYLLGHRPAVIHASNKSNTAYYGLGDCVQTQVCIKENIFNAISAVAKSKSQSLKLKIDPVSSESYLVELVVNEALEKVFIEGIAITDEDALLDLMPREMERLIRQQAAALNVTIAEQVVQLAKECLEQRQQITDTGKRTLPMLQMTMTPEEQAIYERSRTRLELVLQEELLRQRESKP